MSTEKKEEALQEKTEEPVDAKKKKKRVSKTKGVYAKTKKKTSKLFSFN